MRMTFFPKISVSTSDFDSQCEQGVFAEQGFEWNLIFVLHRKFSGRLKRLFVRLVPRVTVYQQNATHRPSTVFRWRCDEVEMRGTCSEAQKSMQANLIINS